MNRFESLLWPGIALAIGALTWCACRWWYGRRLRFVANHLDKTDKARLFSIQQTLQARKQIEKLQKDLAVQQHELSRLQAVPRPGREFDAGRCGADRDRDGGSAGAVRAAMPAHGFADTEPL